MDSVKKRIVYLLAMNNFGIGYFLLACLQGMYMPTPNTSIEILKTTNNRLNILLSQAPTSHSTYKNLPKHSMANQLKQRWNSQ